MSDIDGMVPEDPVEDGIPEAGTREDDLLSDLGEDPAADELLEEETVANDPLAGETVFPGAGEGNAGPTGGAPHEVEPVYAENDLEDEDLVLEDDSPDAARPEGDSGAVPR